LHGSHVCTADGKELKWQRPRWHSK
jgi:hypothetical protein